MNRRPSNWPAALDAYLDEAASRPFVWGEWDCVHYVAGWLERLGYVAPLAGLGKWSGPLSAWRVQLARGGFASAVVERMATLGCEQVATAYTHRGDLALVQVNGRQALAIVHVGRAIALTSDGLIGVPLTSILTAWKV